MASQAAVLLLLGVTVWTGSGREFLGAKRTINSASVRTELEGVLGEVLGHGHGVMHARLDKIHKTLDPLFRSLPKNSQGSVSAPIMRYAVRRYFSQNHGWIVKGFSPHGEEGNASISGDTDILQTKLPGYIRSLLEDRFAYHGFSLDAVVAMVASVERLAFDEVVRGVELGFRLNSIDRTQVLNKHDLAEIISSFLIIEMLEGTEDKQKHLKDKKLIHRRYPFWDTTLLFLKDTIGSDAFLRQPASNPFSEKTYSFEDAVRIAERVSEEFGSWSNHECHEMKDMLTEMDLHNTGRVKMADFYGNSKNGAWQFLEPAEQLRHAGALDESSAWLGPQVMIPNYINSLSNCITSAPYYSICCLNECDQVFQQIEANIAASTGTPLDILQALESGTHASNISELHRERLDQVARKSGGSIPIYGRLFARWLHFVYPQECPYPHATGVVKPMTQQQWKEMVGAEAESASDDEIAGHIDSEFASRSSSPDAGVLMWSLDESLMEFSTPSDLAASPLAALVRIAAQIGMLVAVMTVLLQMLRSDKKAKPVEYDV